ncbi:hypothetical protein CYMTET_45245 [Cymbomonas tetramitiformis]|uniref:Uncharacterized protein n=1 Tax=Cymbomonas tetramitiformis TaxID=36881 RepID=A0AAE0BYL2_9CHLO|nr:hypothetical protein CYMTET_45245 [Cymbomonas tetramitiformis]
MNQPSSISPLGHSVTYLPTPTLRDMVDIRAFFKSPEDEPAEEENTPVKPDAEPLPRKRKRSSVERLQVPAESPGAAQAPCEAARSKLAEPSLLARRQDAGEDRGEEEEVHDEGGRTPTPSHKRLRYPKGSKQERAQRQQGLRDSGWTVVAVDNVGHYQYTSPAGDAHFRNLREAWLHHTGGSAEEVLEEEAEARARHRRMPGSPRGCGRGQALRVRGASKQGPSSPLSPAAPKKGCGKKSARKSKVKERKEEEEKEEEEDIFPAVEEEEEAWAPVGDGLNRLSSMDTEMMTKRRLLDPVDVRHSASAGRSRRASNSPKHECRFELLPLSSRSH